MEKQKHIIKWKIKKYKLHWRKDYMVKPIRKAVRCYLIKDNKVVVTKYKEGKKKQGIMKYRVEKLKKEKLQNRQL